MLATGCARVGGTTEVKADGSFTRTLVFVGEKPKVAGAPGAGMSMGQTIDQVVIVPREPGWEVSKTYKESEVTITAKKDFAAGENVIDDLRIKEGPNKPGSVLGNTVTVTKRPDGKLEYTEIIRWRGPKTDVGGEDQKIVEELKRILPADKVTDTAALSVAAKSIQKDLVKLILGPGEPLFGLLIAHQDYAEFKLKKSVGASIRRALETGFGDKLTPAERDAAIKAVLTEVTAKATSSSKPSPPGFGDDENAEGKKKSGNDSMVAILLKVKLPGKVVETNGELDPESGEVVWPFYSQAPAAGDITLTAICEP